MLALLMSLLFINTTILTLAESHQSLQLEPEMFTEIDPNESSQNSKDDIWQMRQLPAVSTNGPDTPIQLLDMVINDDDGIYFILAQSEGYGRYDGAWTIQLGDISFDVRDYTGGCDTCAVSILAKLSLDGDWQWAKFLSSNMGNFDGSKLVDLFLWSGNSVAISGKYVYQEDAFTNPMDFAVFSTNGDLLQSFELPNNAHPDYNWGYLGSSEGKHYFVDQWHPEHNPSMFNLSLCDENLDSSPWLFYFYSLNSEFIPELIFASTAKTDPRSYFAHDIFTFNLNAYYNIPEGGAHKIYFDEGCLSNATITSSNDDISMGNFSNGPVIVFTYNSINEVLSPLAMMSTGCSIQEVVDTQYFSSEECIIATGGGFSSSSGGYHAMWHLSISLMDENWTWGNDFTTLVDIPDGQTSPYEFDTLVLRIEDLINPNFESVEVNAVPSPISEIHDGFTGTWFWHSGLGVFNDYDSAIHGEVSTLNTPWFVNNVTFDIFDTIPYGTSNNNVSNWVLYCECMPGEDSSTNGIFLNHHYPNWDNKPDYIDSYRYGNNLNPDIFLRSNFGTVMVIDNHLHTPYIYEYSSGLSGIPVSSSGQHIFILAMGEIANILMPFEKISTFDGIVELNHQNTDSSQNADDSNQDNTLMCELSIELQGSMSRSCSIPANDIDWDGSINSADDDQDGDGYPDSLEYLNSMSSPSDPNSGDFSVMENPDLDIIHSVYITTTETGFSMNVDYKLDYSMTMVHFAFVTQTDENGNQVDPMDIDYNVNSPSEKNRFEQQLCNQPYPTSPEISIDNWLSGYSHSVNFDTMSWSCEWENRRSIDYMEFMMMQASPDADEIYTNREVLRYSADVIIPSSGSYTLNIPMYLAEMMENEYDQMNWKIVIDDNSPVIFYPTNESAQVTFSVTIPTGTTDTGQGNINNQQSGNQISPADQTGWVLIIDVDEGSFDCTGINGLNQWDRTNLNGYQEFSLNDGGVSIMCLGNFESISNPDPSACLYLFKDGNQIGKDCDTSMFASVSVDGVEQQLDDLERDLDNLNNDLDNFNDDLDNSLDEIDDSIDEFIDFMIGGLILGAPIYLVFILVKKRREMQEEQEIENEYDSFVNSFESTTKSKPVPHIEETNSISEPLEPETNHNYRVPPFSFQGEVNDDGWEICEYPVSSGTWWWKDYQTETWVLWE
jgi:hypothetical protein